MGEECGSSKPPKGSCLGSLAAVAPQCVSLQVPGEEAIHTGHTGVDQTVLRQWRTLYPPNPLMTSELNILMVTIYSNLLVFREVS